MQARIVWERPIAESFMRNMDFSFIGREKQIRLKK